MADKTISQLTAASSITASDLFVLEQSGTAKKLTGQILENWLVSYADGHGGIQSVAKTGTSGLVDTYTITYADTNTSTFTVTNGAKGDTGAAAYVYIRYSAVMPTQNSDMTTTPSKYIGICITTSNTAPTAYTSYSPWYEWKGAKGDPSEITSQSVKYQIGNSYGDMPTGTWVDIGDIGTISGGDYLWSKATVVFDNDDENAVVTYAKSRQGVDGISTPATETPLADSGDGTVGTSTNFAREDHVHPYVQQVTTENYSIDNVTVGYSGDSSLYTWTKNVTKTGYTPLMVTYRIANATTNGSKSSFISVYSCYINGSNAVVNLRNTHGSGDAKILIAITVLYVKS